MAMTEEQKIEFIISKIDVYLDELEEGDIKEALNIIVSNYMSDDERKTFITYFYKLFKGYNKYKHINLLIDYHKNIEKLALDTNEVKCDIVNCQQSIKKTIIDELADEILDIDTINSNEMIKLKIFFSKLIITLFSFAIFLYLMFMILFLKDPSEIFVGLSKMFQ